MHTLTATRLSRTPVELPAPDIEALASRLQGRLLMPGNPDYERRRHVWNGQIDRHPVLIAQCTTPDDVATAVDFARRHALLTAVRGGGHNVGGTAMADGGLVIDLEGLKGIEIDAERGLACVGGGVTWGELDAATQRHGLATPGGVVSTTGVAGLTLSGGIGWLRRRYGLSCDNLVEVELVGADGRRHVASAEHNPELFWGLRGGGGNFGVVTAFTFRLHPVGPEVMFSATFYPAGIGGEVLRAYRDFTEQAPEAVSSFAICGTIPEEPDYPEAAHGAPYVLLAACYAGDPAEGERVTAPLRELGTPLTDFSGVMPFVEVQQLLDGDYPQGRQYYWKSRYLRRFDDAAIERLLELAAERPSDLSTVDVWHLGGAMARYDGGPTAFETRDAPYLLGVESNWDEPAASATNIAWTREACERFAPFADEAGYLNFEPAEEGSAAQAFTAHHDRLRRLKRDWDPDNLFRLNHNIAPAD